MRYGTGEYYTSVSMRSAVLDAMLWRLYDGTTHEAYCEIGTGWIVFIFLYKSFFPSRANCATLCEMRPNKMKKNGKNENIRIQRQKISDENK